MRSASLVASCFVGVAKRGAEDDTMLFRMLLLDCDDMMLLRVTFK